MRVYKLYGDYTISRIKFNFEKINVELSENFSMKYWLCITTEDNWKIIRDKNIWGVPERHKNTIAKVKPGDKLLIYVKQERIGRDVKESRIMAVYEVVSEVFRDLKKVQLT